MPLTLSLPPHVEARIQAEAFKLSLPVEEYLAQLVTQTFEQQSATEVVGQVPSNIAHLSVTGISSNQNQFVAQEDASALAERMTSSKPLQIADLRSYVSVSRDQAVSIDECCENHD